MFCNKPTNNPKYCSKSCACKNNNRLFPKRKPEGNCYICKNPITNDLKYCTICRKKYIHFNSKKDLTLKEAIYLNHHKSSAFALVRSRARIIIKSLGWTSCFVCGYNKHVEACHITKISDFSLETSINTINLPNNLLALCRNCHWEFDHRLLEISSIKSNPNSLDRI